MKQYCRYCCSAVGHDSDLIWCSAKKKFLKGTTITSPNNCPAFEFCPIDALNPDREYKPREEKLAEETEDHITDNQITLFQED